MGRKEKKQTQWKSKWMREKEREMRVLWKIVCVRCPTFLFLPVLMTTHGTVSAHPCTILTSPSDSHTPPAAATVASTPQAVGGRHTQRDGTLRRKPAHRTYDTSKYPGKSTVQWASQGLKTERRDTSKRTWRRHEAGRSSGGPVQVSTSRESSGICWQTAWPPSWSCVWEWRGRRGGGRWCLTPAGVWDTRRRVRSVWVGRERRGSHPSLPGTPAPPVKRKEKGKYKLGECLDNGSVDVWCVCTSLFGVTDSLKNECVSRRTSANTTVNTSTSLSENTISERHEDICINKDKYLWSG